MMIRVPWEPSSAPGTSAQEDQEHKRGSHPVFFFRPLWKGEAWDEENFLLPQQKLKT